MAFASLEALIEAVAEGQPRAVGRLISMVENASPHLRSAMKLLAPSTGRAQVIGITGSPGVGKSTTTTGLLTALRQRGQRVGVLAVDPSSPFSGGALLGDRVRMQQHAQDDGVYIRSMASRGHLGGLAAAAPQALRVFDHAGCDIVLVETVGVGQSEVEIASTADTTLVLMAPGMGDGIQAAKAGILEIGDIFVVNKSDREGAQSLVRDLRSMVALENRTADQWKPPIVKTVASTADGIEDLLVKIDQHREHSQADGSWQLRRLHRARAEVEALALGTLRSRFVLHGRSGLDDVAVGVRDGRLDPYEAAERVVEQV